MFVLPTFGLGVIGSPIVPPFNVTNRDTEANILASTPTLSAGEAGIAFGTDTNDFYIYDGSAWYIFNNDS
jgi:hypothetical protein